MCLNVHNGKRFSPQDPIDEAQNNCTTLVKHVCILINMTDFTLRVWS